MENKIQSRLDKIKHLLNDAIEENKIFYWKIDNVVVERRNIYVEKDYMVESELGAKRDDLQITIYKEFKEGEKIGESSFSFNKQNSIEEFEKELEDAIFISQFSKSNTYKLPNNSDDIINDMDINYVDFHNSKFHEEFKSGDLDLLVLEKIGIFKSLIETQNNNDVKNQNLSMLLNSLELFNKISKSSLETSSGIEKSFKKNSTYLEFIITIINNLTGDEIEHIVYESINDIYTFNFEEFFTKHIDFVKDKIKAKNMSNFKGKVILKDFAAYDFFIPSPQNCSVLMHASARLKFFDLSNYELEKTVFEPKYDKFTVHSNPLRKNNAYSTPFDGLGVSAKRLCLIKDNIFKNYFASVQYADYLGVKPTGPIGSFEIESGDKSFNEFYNEKEDIVEILAFAWFAPDIISGNVSAEIRLGYIVKSSGEKIPFTGGLFVANLFKLLEEVEFSKEKIEKPGYYGPKVIKFHNAEIVGVDE